MLIKKIKKKWMRLDDHSDIFWIKKIKPHLEMQIMRILIVLL